MKTPRRNSPILIVAAFFCACLAASDAFCHTFDPRFGMIVDSVLYLQKSIPAAEAEQNKQNITVRVAPIITVTAGLLDAGVAPDEPLVQSGLSFLHRFHDDNKSRIQYGDDPALSALLAKIETCLTKASQGTSPNNSNDDSPDETAFLLQALVSLDDSEATARAVGFVQKINGETSNDDARLDETRYVFSPGGVSIRVRELRQAAAELDDLPIRGLSPFDRWSPEQFDGFIACVHGLKDYPPPPGLPSRPEPSSTFAATSPISRLSDSRKTIPGQQGPFALVAFRLPAPGRGLSQTLSQTLLPADSLAALQTVRRLE